MALVVIAVVNGVAVILQRRGDSACPGQARTLAPIWPLRRPEERWPDPEPSPADPDRTDNPAKGMAHSIAEPSKEDAVLDQHRHEPATTSTNGRRGGSTSRSSSGPTICGEPYLRMEALPRGESSSRSPSPPPFSSRSPSSSGRSAEGDGQTPRPDSHSSSSIGRSSRTSICTWSVTKSSTQPRNCRRLV
jgi:hypothetical protein